jgi:putative endonuclease
MSKVFQRGGCVYIMANLYHNVLYTGVTSDIIGRVSDHKNNVYPTSFTAKYKCHKLVYYCFYSHIEEAIAEEKRIKGSGKEYKRQLVSSINPGWVDLYASLLE